jgi:predicted Zn finger-like uncharacterized protein
MPIAVSCPSCSTNLKVPDTAAGRKVRCPKCSTPFDVAATPPEEVAEVAEVVEDMGVRHPGPPPLPTPQHRPAPVRAYADDDRYDDRPPPQHYRRPPAPEGPGTGLQMGLGIASLAVGAGGLVIAMIPCVGFIPGLVGAGTGLVLGLVGLIVAMTQKNRGIAFPIAGSATSAVGLGVAFLMWMLVYKAVHDTVNLAKDFQKNAFELMRQKANEFEAAKRERARVDCRTLAKALQAFELEDPKNAKLQDDNWGPLLQPRGPRPALVEPVTIIDPWGRRYHFSMAQRSPAGEPKVWSDGPPGGAAPISNW